jgi:energy-coupling factor transport system permease protein
MYSDPLAIHTYSNHHSWCHQIDSRAKLVVVAAWLVFGLVAVSVSFHLIMIGVIGLALVSSGVSGQVFWQTGKSLLLLVAITFLFHLLFTDSAEPPLVTLAGFSVTSTALLRGAFFVARLVLFVSVVMFLTLTTPPTDLAEAVVKLARPLRRLRIPVDDIGLILSLSLRFIPILRDEFVAIRRAQMLRGVAFAGSFIRRIHMTSSLLVPVFVAAVGRADQIALAIEARGYRHGIKRTYFSRSIFGRVEWTFVIVSVAFAALLFLVTKQVWR